MKKTFSKIAVAALVAGAMLTAGTASANPTKVAGKHAKHAKHHLTRFLGCGTDLECNDAGSSVMVTRIFGVAVHSSSGVPNSALCQ